MRGVEILATAPAPPAIALAFLAAQVLECLLKAAITAGDPSNTEVTSLNLRHNLSGLWSRAVELGLAVSRSPPDWVDCLSGLHNKPYYLRYSTGINGVVTPNSEQMAEGLTALMDIVRARVHSS